MVDVVHCISSEHFSFELKWTYSIQLVIILAYILVPKSVDISRTLSYDTDKPSSCSLSISSHLRAYCEET